MVVLFPISGISEGGTSTQQYPTYLYTTPGQYNLCLTVDDTSGCQSTFCDTIDIVVKKISGTTLNVIDPNDSSSIDEYVLNEFKLYPNPSSGEFVISFESKLEGTSEFVMTDINGAKVFSEQIVYVSGLNKVDIFTPLLSPGIYFYSLNGHKGKLLRR